MSSSFDLRETRNNLVAKDNRLIQNSRYALNSNENKAVLYLISKIQPDDEPGKKYLFNCKEFQALIKWNGAASYKNIKDMLTKLSDMRWWVDIDDESEALVRWFHIVRMKKSTGDIEISFHEDMFPFLLNLQQHLEENGQYFTAYRLQNVTLMKHRYSPRIYEILKSYQFNNKKWTFENGTGTKYDLQRMIGDTTLNDGSGEKPPTVKESWSNWAVFKRDVLEPAIEEINKYTDIKVAYEGKKKDIYHRKTRAIRTIEFYMVGKTEPEQRETDQIIDAEYTVIEDEHNYHQMSIEELFFQAHEKSLEEERAERELFEAAKREEQIGKSKHQILFAELNDDRHANLDEKKVAQLYSTAIKGRVIGGDVPRTAWELFATDLVLYYYDKIVATPEDTKTTLYKRLLDCVKNDYDNQVYELLGQYRR